MGFSQAAQVHFDEHHVNYTLRIDRHNLIISYAVQAELIMHC